MIFDETDLSDNFTVRLRYPADLSIDKPDLPPLIDAVHHLHLDAAMKHKGIAPAIVRSRLNIHKRQPLRWHAVHWHLCTTGR